METTAAIYLKRFGAAQAFVAVLEGASAMFKLRGHAYVLMRNHFHFALETPQPKSGRGHALAPKHDGDSF